MNCFFFVEASLTKLFLYFSRTSLMHNSLFNLRDGQMIFAQCLEQTRRDGRNLKNG